MDLIKKEQAVKEICRKVREEENNAIPGEDLDVGVVVGLKMAVRIIKEQPSAEKTGHWENGENNIGMKRYICSICGKGQPYLRFNYCPNCGAKMEVQ